MNDNRPIRVLIDTNVLIGLEDTNTVLSDSLAQIKRISQENNVIFFLHPAQEIDIQNDKDVRRRKLLIQRAKQYPKLSITFHSPPTDNRTNNYVDNLLLEAVINNAVGYLVTEDVDLYKKAQKNRNIAGRILYVGQFYAWLEKEFIQLETHLSYDLNDDFLYAMNSKYNINLNSPFFASLKEDYEEFDDWWARISKAHRKAWLVFEQGRLGAICIYKNERNETVYGFNNAQRTNLLKLCTFKVDGNFQGRKIGERLLYQAFKYAKENNFCVIYIEIKPRHEHLINLCEEYGFIKFGQKTTNGDLIYLKDMHPRNDESLSSLDYLIRYYPHYRDDESVKKHIVPIIPKFHQQLFPDTNKGYIPGLEPPVRSEGRAIKKAYICHANTRSLQEGDIVLFYQSRQQTIEVLGIIESVKTTSEFEDLSRIVSKRTVYNQEDLRALAQKECLVIMFRLVKMMRPFKLPKVINCPQSIQTITHENFRILKEKINA